MLRMKDRGGAGCGASEWTESGKQPRAGKDSEAWNPEGCTPGLGPELKKVAGSERPICEGKARGRAAAHEQKARWGKEGATWKSKRRGTGKVKLGQVVS